MDNGRLPTVYRLSRPPFFVILSRTNGSLHSRNQALQGFFSRDCGIRMTNAVRDHHDNMGTLFTTCGLEKDLSRAGTSVPRRMKHPSIRRETDGPLTDRRTFRPGTAIRQSSFPSTVRLCSP